MSDLMIGFLMGLGFLIVPGLLGGGMALLAHHWEMKEKRGRE